MRMTRLKVGFLVFLGVFGCAVTYKCALVAGWIRAIS
jgi:hypothetical protein